MTIKDTSDAGSVVAWLTLPQPWPVSQPVTLIAHQLNGRIIRATCKSTGCIEARLIDTSNSETALGVSSCPLAVKDPMMLMLGVVWDLPHEMRIHINDAIVGSAQTPSDAPDHYEIAERTDKPDVPAEDFARQNGTVLIQRRGTIAGTQPRRGRIAGTKEHAFASLKEEAAQIGDNLKALDAGAIYHARGLANSVCLLMADGRPMPLLQICAAHLDASLILYTSHRPSTPIPLSPNVSIAFDLSAEPTPAFKNPIDLDAWLDLPAASLDDGPFTHKQVIRAIRNTTGSHADYDIDPLVAFLRSSSTSAATGAAEHDLLVEYVRNLALIASRLAHILMES